MNIKVNGEDTTIDGVDVTVSQLLKLKDVNMPEMVTVEYNGDILDRELFDSTFIKSDDEIEFLYFMGGGAISR